MAAKAAELKRISACSSDHSSSLRVQSVIESSQRDSHAEQAGGVNHSKFSHERVAIVSIAIVSIAIVSIATVSMAIVV